MAVKILDVARLAGVSSATVSRVLTKKASVSSDSIAKVEKAIKDLNYRPNRTARSLRVQKSTVIGLVISDIQNSFFNKVMKAVEDKALQHGYSVYLCNSDEDKQREQNYLDLLLDEQVAGMIVTPLQIDTKPYQVFSDANIPIVMIDRNVENIEVDTVITNNVETSFMLNNNLIMKGHKKIATILSDLTITTGRERLEGYKEALSKNNIEYDSDLVFTGKPTMDDGYKLAKQLFSDHKPTAVFTGSKMITLGLLRYLYEHDIKIPDEIEIAAFDVLDWMPYMPDMLVAEQPAFDLGTQAAELLMQRIEDIDRPVERVVLASRIQKASYSKTRLVPAGNL